jgi:hypothetical protein
MKKLLLIAMAIFCSTLLATAQVKIKTNNGTEITVKGRLIGNVKDGAWPIKIIADVSDGKLTFTEVVNQPSGELFKFLTTVVLLKDIRDANGIMEPVAASDPYDNVFRALLFFTTDSDNREFIYYDNNTGEQKSSRGGNGYFNAYSDSKQSVSTLIEAIKNGGYKGTSFKQDEVVTNKKEETPKTQTGTDKVNKAKTEATIELRNRSKASANIIITSPNGGSKNNFSINASSSKKERIKVGSTVSVNGNVVLTVTADMDGESKIIAQ